MNHDERLRDLMVPDALHQKAKAAFRESNPLRVIAQLLVDSAKDLPLPDLSASAMALRAAAPTDRALWSITDILLYSQVPNYHWAMVADAPRNTAYAKAISTCIEPGMVVLEIGAGSGLLAMMAARAGADHVYTIEANPLMARIARTCIDRNGYADRITVLEGHSSTFAPGNGLGTRADVLVHEILSSDLLGEGVLPSVAHAKSELLTADALLIPHGLGAAGALAQPPAMTRAASVSVEGFDLSALSVIGAAVEKYGARRCKQLSNACKLYDVDLRGDFALKGSKNIQMTATTPGVAMGIEQWLALGFPNGTLLLTDEPASHWQTCFHPFGSEFEVSIGQSVDLTVEHGPDSLTIQLSGEAG